MAEEKTLTVEEVQNRVQELVYIKASDLRENPANWRRHPEQQKAAMSSAMGRVGIVAPLMGRKMPDGKIELLDGHMRAEISGDAIVPVVLTDLDDDEAKEVLATLDPLTLMAETDSDALRELLGDMDLDDEMQGLLKDMAIDGDEWITFDDRNDDLPLNDDEGAEDAGEEDGEEHQTSAPTALIVHCDLDESKAVREAVLESIRPFESAKIV